MSHFYVSYDIGRLSKSSEERASDAEYENAIYKGLQSLALDGIKSTQNHN